MKRAGIFLACAAITAAMFWTMAVGLAADSRGREEGLFVLGMFAVAFAGLLVLPGVVLTIASMRWPRTWLRRSYYTVLFLLTVANFLIFTTDGGDYAMMFCWECPLEALLAQTIIPASLFVALAPLLAPLLAPGAWSPVEGQGLGRMVDGRLHKPPDGARVSKATLWMAGVPWLLWITAPLMTSTWGSIPGGGTLVVIHPSYAAAFVITLIGTPVLGYRVFRDLRQMTRLQRVWAVAGLAAAIAFFVVAAPVMRGRYVR